MGREMGREVTNKVNRLEALTRELRGQGKKALVPFLTAGYPDRETFFGLAEAVARSGCSIMEIGVPFSDPVADGPVIQAASQQALAQGVTLTESLAMAGQVHQQHGVEVVLMGYLNPVLHFGPEKFAAACREQEVTGLIIPDLPPEEAQGLRQLLAENGVALIDLVAPTTTPVRLENIARLAAGFLYLVSVTGVTGSGLKAGSDLSRYLDRVGQACDLPRYVGFGVSSGMQAAEICQHADGVIIGSKLLQLVSEAGSTDEAVIKVESFLNDVIRALNPAEG